jgi:hypothetical protein
MRRNGLDTGIGHDEKGKKKRRLALTHLSICDVVTHFDTAMHRNNPHSLPPIPTHPQLITPASEPQPSSPDIVLGQTSQYAAVNFIDNNTDPPGTLKTTSLSETELH